MANWLDVVACLIFPLPNLYKNIEHIVFKMAASI